MVQIPDNFKLTSPSMNPLLVKGILSLPLLFEKTVSISGKKNQKRCEEIAKEISKAANYRMNQTCLRFLFCLPRQSKQSGLSISEKRLAKRNAT